MKDQYNADPTRTTALRNAFANDMKRRFTKLERVIKESIVDNDCFGLKKQTFVAYEDPKAAAVGAFIFARSDKKLAEFIKWLERQIELGLITVKELEQIGTGIEAFWTNKYIYDSYKRGVIRARQEMIRMGMQIPSIEQSGGIENVMGTPFHMDRVGVLYTRVYTDLKGITSAMDSIISRILAQGMADGDGPILLARKILSAINGVNAGTLGITDSIGRFIPAKRRAEMLARTEMIRAHHLANIQEYRNWGLEGVVVKGEFRTAGDDRVCPACAALEGKIFTLDEIEPLIPLHPQCRCMALPYVEEFINRQNQRRTKK